MRQLLQNSTAFAVEFCVIYDEKLRYVDSMLSYKTATVQSRTIQRYFPVGQIVVAVILDTQLTQSTTTFSTFLFNNA